jgi:phosphoglycolate phosphatase
MHKNTYRAVIFDMDGTLLDTIDDIAESMNGALRRMGYPSHPVRSYLNFVGEGIEVLAMRSLPEKDRTIEIISRAVTYMREEYSTRWGDKSRPFEGIPEALDGLAGRGVSMSILSNKLDSFTKAMAAALLPDWRFDEVRGLTHDCPRKPDPAGAWLCAERMGVVPGHCVFVGDSGIDMETAVRAGMAPVGVLWGYQDSDRLLAGGARVLMHEPGELLGFFQSG